MQNTSKLCWFKQEKLKQKQTKTNWNSYGVQRRQIQYCQNTTRSGISIFSDSLFCLIKISLSLSVTLKGSCLCPELFNRQQQHVRLQLVYWVCQCFHAGVFQKCSFSHCAVTESMGLMVAMNIITLWQRRMHLKHLSWSLISIPFFLKMIPVIVSKEMQRN